MNLILAILADVVVLRDGQKMEGVTVLLENADSIVVRSGFGTHTIDRADVLSIERSKRPARVAKGRLANWETCMDIIAERPWAGKLRQVPATVIDKGVLKHVPYKSFKSGDFEFNVYGDPEAPSCLEIGVTKNPGARRECLETMLLLLGEAADRDMLKSLSLDIDKKTRDGLTFEVTPDTAVDAYGAWWISIYDPKQLDAQRASEKELDDITVKFADVEKEKGKDLHVWRPHDLRHARAVKGAIPPRAYVRGFARPGGKYKR